MPKDTAYASAPFDHAKADVILRSSDNVDFRTFKLLLSLTSPFFETLFNLPQPTQVSEDQETKDGLAVIPVTEDSKSLDALLRFCYPCTMADEPRVEDPQVALHILNAAQKYGLDVIERKALQVIMDQKMLEAAPLRCFAIACGGRLRKETLLAAKYTLSEPLVPDEFQEIGLISTRDLLSLLAYHRKCGDAVYALRLDLSWIRSHYKNVSCDWLHGRGYYNNRYTDCECASSDEPRYGLFIPRSPQWWEHFMEETFLELRDKPCKATVQALADKTTKAVKAKNCPTCSPKVTGGMRDLVKLFEGKIEQTVAQIELELKF